MIKINARPIRKGIYLIQEKGCLNQFSGAFQHISMGIEHLGNSFELSVYLNNQRLTLESFRTKHFSPNQHKLKKDKVVKGPFYGLLKDLYLFSMSLLSAYSLIKLFKKVQPDFIYERAAHLNYAGLIASKVCKIPHFYEANGLQFESKEQFYKSFFKPISKRLEKESYKKSTHVFFVGTYGDYWRIKKNNWSNVENGIESENLVQIKECYRFQDKTKLCFVGKFMAHQGLEILVDGLSLIDIKENFQVHLIGADLETIAEDLENIGVETVNHGFIGRDKIIRFLSSMDIGLICGSPSYQSCMKLFDYGAAGIVVLAPEIHNLKYWFPNEIVFFDGTALDFSQKVVQLAETTNMRHTYGENLQSRIKNEFTWESIFQRKIEIINTFY